MSSSTLRRVVVVGGSIAAVSAADTLRSEGFAGEIVVVGDEPHPAYARPALSKGLLAGTETVESVLLPRLGPDIEVLRGTPACGLDLARRRVLVGNRTIAFDGIVLATGARARQMARPGLDGECVIRSIDDVLAFQDVVQGQSHVAILGGGFLGMELASSLRLLGHPVTVVDIAAPLVRQLGPDLAGMFTAAALDNGVRIEVSAGGARLLGSKRVTGILLADGPHVVADVVVTAVGDVPNTEWLAGSGLRAAGPLPIGAGGRVDNDLPDVVAAGDMAIQVDPLTGVATRTPHWHGAISQGRQAARTLLGLPCPAAPDIPYFWTEGFGLDVKITGTVPPGTAPDVVSGSVADRCAVLQWSDKSGPVAAAAINHRMPLVKLKRLARSDIEVSA